MLGCICPIDVVQFLMPIWSYLLISFDILFISSCLIYAYNLLLFLPFKFTFKMPLKSFTNCFTSYPYLNYLFSSTKLVLHFVKSVHLTTQGKLVGQILDSWSRMFLSALPAHLAQAQASMLWSTKVPCCQMSYITKIAI